MKTFNVNGKLGSFDVSLPESLEEISNEYLESCTNFIHPAPNYAVVAIVYKDSLSLVLSSAQKKKPTNISIVPVFIKAGTNDSEFIKSLSCGDKVVISGSALSLAHHINSPYNKITPNNIVNICDGDRRIYSEAFSFSNPVCFVEFKLIAVNEIHGHLDNTKNSFINPFIRKTTDVVAEA